MSTKVFHASQPSGPVHQQETNLGLPFIRSLFIILTGPVRKYTKLPPPRSLMAPATILLPPLPLYQGHFKASVMSCYGSVASDSVGYNSSNCSCSRCGCTCVDSRGCCLVIWQILVFPGSVLLVFYLSLAVWSLLEDRCGTVCTPQLTTLASLV